MNFFLKTAFKSKRFRLSFITLSIILLLNIIIPLVSKVDPMSMDGVHFERPNLFEFYKTEKDAEAVPAGNAEVDEAAAALMAQFGIVSSKREAPPKKLRILGTDNFGRDMLAQLLAGTRTSLYIGIMAGLISTSIGLTLGLIAGFKGGMVDNVLSSIINTVIVIPSFVILILISVSVRTRSFVTMALIIGVTSWPWTARAVRSQTISLRNRDHVNLSRLSGHSMPRIITKDVLPYIASYVVTTFIAQMASGILSEARLSMLGLGPHNVASLGLLMSWAMNFSALPNGAWWAFLPVLVVIAVITFSLNILNSGLDEIYNPQLRS